MIDRFLIDECLSPDLAAAARARGHEAYHLVHLGRAGTQDWSIVRFPGTSDHVLVTNNARDFLALFGRLELHDGLIVVLPSVPAREQVWLFEPALERSEICPTSSTGS